MLQPHKFSASQVSSRPRRLLWRFVALIACAFSSSCAKQAQPAPPKAQQQLPPFEFAGSWGDKGDGPGKLHSPVAFAVDARNRVFVADAGVGFVHKFETTGTPLLSFEDPRILHAAGIAVDSGGAIYVADAERGNVVTFFPDGTFLRSAHVAAERRLSNPVGTTVDDGGSLYVVAALARKILKFDSRGKLAKSWSVPQNSAASNDPPSGIAVQSGFLFVEFPRSGQIEKYSSDGAWITAWQAADAVADATSSNSGSLSGIAASGQYIFTSSSHSPRLRVWTLDGQNRLDSDLGGQIDSVAAPQIAVTSGSELLVFDPAAPRMYRFKIHL